MSLSSLEPGPLAVPFAVGDVVADKYKVLGVLGTGGVAYVIAALHLELGEKVALKFLRPESLVHEDVIARFASEARAVARIKSEHVAHVLDVGTLPDGAPFIVMEYLEGKDLADVLAERRRLPIKVAVDYVLQACEALACAHAAGIVHRDIKPENLFLMQVAGSVEMVKVLDFGISKSAMAGVETSGRKSAKTMLPMGTPGYMSPEQIRACSTVDARTDIWALGCVLLELIAGQSAFEAPTQVQLGAVILEREPVALRQIMPGAPAELEAVIARCLQKDANDRFQDVAELALALYPFGPRRSRLSAERCHQVLKGEQGVVIEFNSVPPPSFGGGDTPLPVSSTAALALEPLRSSTPATLSVIEVEYPRPRRRGLVAGLVVAGAAIAGVAFALRPGAGSGTSSVSAASPPGIRATQPTAAEKATPALPGTVTPASPQRARPEPSGIATGFDSAPAQSTSAAAAPVAAPKSAAARAKQARAQRPVAAREATASKPKPAAPRSSGLDDAEPDVGY
jgi:serine/threonine-protein kinase